MFLFVGKWGFMLIFNENRFIFSNLLTEDHINAVMTTSSLLYFCIQFNRYYTVHIHCSQMSNKVILFLNISSITTDYTSRTRYNIW